MALSGPVKLVAKRHSPEYSDASPSDWSMPSSDGVNEKLPPMRPRLPICETGSWPGTDTYGAKFAA